MKKETFKPGDLVYRKSHVHDHGVVLEYHDGHGLDSQYYIVFCRGTEYEAKPYIELLKVKEFSIIEKEVHKPRPPPKFKK